MSSTDASNTLCQKNQVANNRNTFLLQVSFHPVYGSNPLPQSVYKKLPRLINKIPLGAGKLSQTQTNNIRWRYMEGSKDSQIFMSCPLTKEEAIEDRLVFRDTLVKQAKAVFGDVTVKMSIILSECVHFESDVYVNDIADVMEEGLQFHD